MPVVCADRHRNTCIELSRDGGVRYIALMPSGIILAEMPISKFDDTYVLKQLDYPVDKAARNYISFARNLGASKEVVSELVKLIPEDISKEIKMIAEKRDMNDRIKEAKTASKKKSDEQKPPTTKERDMMKKAFFGDKKAAVTLAKPAKAAKATAPKKSAKAEKPTKAEKPAKASSTSKEKKPSASQMFCDLIMGGKLTDEQIFKKVQDAFGLDDNKRSYVKWYRNNLIKQGKKVPAAK